MTSTAVVRAAAKWWADTGRTLLVMFRSKVEMITADQALPGRDTPVSIAPTHVVLGTPLYPPFPDGLAADEHPRPGTTVEKLAKLPPVFRESGTVHAGNSSGITDGAAAVIVAAEEAVDRLGLEPVARLVDWANEGVDPAIMGIGPVPAVRKVLERQEMEVADVDLVELNEAFAAQVLAVARDLELDLARVNPNGGAIALGHPIGATGARIVVTLLHEMARSGARTGFATLCVSGGMGTALLVERAGAGPR